MKYLLGWLVLMMVSTISFAQNTNESMAFPKETTTGNVTGSFGYFGNAELYSNEIEMMYGRPEGFYDSEYYYNTASKRRKVNSNVYYYDELGMSKKKVVVSEKEIYSSTKYNCLE